MLHQAIQNLHLVITTREDPGLPLAHLRVKNQLTEIRAADLRFSPEEAVEYFTKVMSIHLSEDQVNRLGQRTEGWIAGLQLAALSLKDSRDPELSINAFRGTHRHVLDYLLEEVLNGQTEEVRSFLRRTSILEQLSSPLCEAVSGQKNSQQLLRYLERSNLFLVPWMIIAPGIATMPYSLAKVGDRLGWIGVCDWRLATREMHSSVGGVSLYSRHMTGGRRRSTVVQPSNLDSENVYEIMVRGEIDVSWITGFGEAEVQTEIITDGDPQSTLFEIVTDQADQPGLIRRLHGLGVVLVSMRQVLEASDPVQT